MEQHIAYLVFFYLLGSCVGSFLNVVVWRLPRDMSLVHPGSHCPKCNHKLTWRENIPVFGWLLLRGRCRFCSQPISSRYPLVELFTGLVFALYYFLFFMAQSNPPTGPQLLARDWPIFAMDLFLIASLIAASLIDFETYTIPLSLCYWPAGVGLIVHALTDQRFVGGNIMLPAPAMAMSLGAGIGLAISSALLYLGYLPQSFSDGGPALEIEQAQAGPDAEFPEYEPHEIRREIRKEITFLLIPLALSAGALAMFVLSPKFQSFFRALESNSISNGFLSALLGAMSGAFVVWFFRIAGSMAFGKEAMGLGDVHLMFGVGACIGVGPSILAFFISPFFGILVALYLLIFSQKRQVPFGPYLSAATLCIMLLYGPIAEHLRPGFEGLGYMLSRVLGLN